MNNWKVVRFLIYICINLCLCQSHQSADEVEYNLPLHGIELLAESFGQVIYEKCAQTCALSDLRTDYLLMDMQIRPLDGAKMVADIADDLDIMFSKKIHSLKNLETLSRISYEKHFFDDNIRLTYPETKKINASEFELIISERFNNLEVNFTMSTVHIPTNLYEQSPNVLNDVAWSAELDEIFIENLSNDNFLRWQFFCSTTGFFRMFPGTSWYREKSVYNLPDMFDCRMQRWYIQAALQKKSVVLLIDIGSNIKKSFKLAIETIKYILRTLNDDDHLTVVLYNDKSKIMALCQNETTQFATSSVKMKVITMLENIELIGSSNLEAGLALSTEILTNATEANIFCRRAIIIVTNFVDVPTSHYTNETVFQVHIFLFLINPKKPNTGMLKGLVCKNRGYYAFIYNKEDIVERIQNYVQAFSKYAPGNDTIWSHVYEDSAGLGLVATLARPIYGQRIEEKYSKLIGVVGIDISVTELQEKTQRVELGVNSYSFAISNKGQALYHPLLKKKKEALNHFHQKHIDLKDLEQTHSIDELRTKMMQREKGHLKSETNYLSPDGGKILTRVVDYYFTYLEGLPYSIALALPEKYGHYYANGRKPLSFFELSSIKTDEILLNSGHFCNQSLLSDGSIEVFVRLLMDSKDDDEFYRRNCKEDLVDSLLFDIEVTSNVINDWTKENWNEKSVNNPYVPLVFLCTRSGLTRFLSLQPDFKYQEYIEKLHMGNSASFYLNAVENGEEVFTFSLMQNKAKSSVDDLYLIGSSPIVVTDSGNEAVMGVAGLLLKFSAFREIFAKTTPYCKTTGAPECMKTCQTDEIECYLLDYNGYVMLSENSNEIGKFYGELEGSASLLMKELIMDTSENYNDIIGKGVFKKVQMTNYHAICEVVDRQSSHSSTIISIFQAIQRFFLLFCSFVNDFIMLNIQFDLKQSVFSIIFGVSFATENSTYPDSEPSPPNPDGSKIIDFEAFSQLLNDLTKLAPDEVLQWRSRCIDQTSSVELAYNCLLKIKDNYGPGVIGQKPCTQIFDRYTVDPFQLPQTGVVMKCDQCYKTFSINNVPKTNLLLLAVDSMCVCQSDPSYTSRPKEILSDIDVECEKSIIAELPEEIECPLYNIMAEEECGIACKNINSISTLISIVIIKYFINS